MIIGAALQRFAILVMLFGGVLELSTGGTGMGILIFALLVGAVGLLLELFPQVTDREASTTE
ncbi:hypothetical protein [Natrinema soli]|uniref:Uncharacterized protein n=1 Tax=Natrinema soli TaxID=1930624 RepID=A0ABD5SQ76_9EURY|nr:hypothetical protein [Natrinema soli]